MNHTVSVNIDPQDYASFQANVANILDQSNLEPTPEFIERNYLKAEYGDWFDEGHTICSWDDVKDFIIVNYSQLGQFVSASFTFHEARDAAFFKLTFGGV